MLSLLQSVLFKPVITTATLDSAADPEGYYQIILGEQLDSGRYQVFSSLGKGMFSNVVRARILTGEGSEVGKEVAIKIVRAQESMWVSLMQLFSTIYLFQVLGIGQD